jgi:phosphoenolpyruvate-protein phosphotransferase (PTS system enzyme I)
LQFETYKKAIEACGGRILIIRTLDIGGDKSLPYFNYKKEENPFLGWRGIRISLALKDVFKTQLRAILRASAYGKIKIMFPMIVSLEEFREAKEMVEKCKRELSEEIIVFNKNIELGVMIETPASVMIAEDLAKEVNFFSIGTNDLTQYTLAADRGNGQIAKIYNSFHPAILRSIFKVIKTGLKYKKQVGICGEFAGDPKAVLLLLGMGLTEFSVLSNDIQDIKLIISNANYSEAKIMAKLACGKSTLTEIEHLLELDKK